MTGDLSPTAGVVNRHTHLNIGRYHQHSVDQLDPNKEVLQVRGVAALLECWVVLGMWCWTLSWVLTEEGDYCALSRFFSWQAWTGTCLYSIAPLFIPLSSCLHHSSSRIRTRMISPLAGTGRRMNGAPSLASTVSPGRCRRR